MSKKILVVDDEPEVLQVLMLRLEMTGYEVLGAKDGREALDLAYSMMPDLIVLDFYLPDMNGDEVVKIIKEDRELKHIPILLISAITESVAQKAKETGAEGSLRKPFELDELVDKVGKMLGKDIGI
jgi:Response regulator containing CheY-like receiver, AAA-type ATPase, and DNA-binding domains